jgi:hypothetical protein
MAQHTTHTARVVSLSDSTTNACRPKPLQSASQNTHVHVHTPTTACCSTVAPSRHHALLGCHQSLHAVPLLLLLTGCLCATRSSLGLPAWTVRHEPPGVLPQTPAGHISTWPTPQHKVSTCETCLLVQMGHFTGQPKSILLMAFRPSP